MKKIILLLLISIYSIVGNGQTRKVLLEEFTGAHCGNCPMAGYTLDSLLGIYPDLIGVSLHSYGVVDAMFFPQIDTIGIAYAPGAPLGAIDRIYNSSWGYVAEMTTNWGASIQTRLAVPPELSISLSSTWNVATRLISAQINTSILTNLPAGDYRFNLYVVEDSVTGSGSGYDQVNLYNGIVGNPFYGMGDPIIGYVHHHVVRAILPQAWGQAGIISAAPTVGQNFTTTINYTLPAGYDETKIKLVAFVSNFSSNHQGDEVLNAVENSLPLISGINAEQKENYFSVYPNPSAGLFVLDSKYANGEIGIYTMLGEKVFTQIIDSEKTSIDVSNLSNGMYMLVFENEKVIVRQKLDILVH